jgi:hypothetical protein
MIEYLAKTLKKMKDCYGFGCGVRCFVWDSYWGRLEMVCEQYQIRKHKGVENTQQKRDVQLFVKGRVLWKNRTYHQLEH